MAKKNCWEHKKCGRESGGLKANELGVCPAALDASSEGKNKGKAGGRYCWKIAGTLCGGEVQGSWAKKLKNCVTCEFFLLVQDEEGPGFEP